MSGFADSIADDYMIVDNTEDVTFTPMNRNPAVAPFTIHYADPHDYTLQEVGSSGGTLVLGDRQWGLGNAEFPAGVTPQRGDRITRASGEVDILFAPPVLDSFGVSWFCPSGKAR